MRRGTAWLVGVPVLAYLFLAILAAKTVHNAIERSAEAVADGRPYCLALPSDHRPVETWIDLTPLRAWGNRLSPHLMLWVGKAGGVEAWHWSYGRMRFEPGQPPGTIRNCAPRERFLAILRDEPDGFFLAEADGSRIIPADREPGHVEDDVVLLQFFPGEGARDRVELAPDAVRRWRAAESAEIPVPEAGAVEVSRTGKGGTKEWRFDATGELIETRMCPVTGPCRLTFVARGQLFDVWLAEPSMRPDAVLAVWDGFRVPG